MASEIPVAQPATDCPEADEPQTEQACCTPVAMSAGTVDELATGMMSMVEPGLNQAKVRLQELLREQETLLEKIKETRESYVERPELQEIISVLYDAPIYRAKLQAINRDIKMICDRMRRLKQRALNLEQAKRKQDIVNADALERQRLREKHLEAKPANMPGS